jgi:hypothetical protein
MPLEIDDKPLEVLLLCLAPNVDGFVTTKPTGGRVGCHTNPGARLSALNYGGEILQVSSRVKLP